MENENLPEPEGLDKEIINAISDCMLIAILGGNKGVVERFLKLGALYHSYLFFHTNTISSLQEKIFSDKDLRDFTYSCLVKIKYNLYRAGITYDWVLECIASTGSSDETVRYARAMPVDDIQTSFNGAYLSEYKLRYDVLQSYDWSVVLFLSTMYYTSLLGAFETMLDNKKPEPTP